MIRPLFGATFEQLIRSLRECVASARQITANQSGSVVDIYNSYLSWCSDTIHVLSSCVVPKSIEELVLTKRHWILQSLVVSVVGPVRLLVQSELADRITSFDSAITELESARNRWSGPGSYYVLDSSVYLESPFKLEEPEFVASFSKDQKRPAQIVLPIVVIDELDRRKYSGSDDHRRWRARYTLAVLNRVLAEDVRKPGLLRTGGEVLRGTPVDQVTLEIAFDSLDHLRLPSNDAEIIDRTLSYVFAATSNVVLVTYDTAMATMALSQGLRVVKLSIDAGPERKKSHK